MTTKAPVYGSIGARLRATRVKLGTSQSEMAAAARIPVDTYKKYEGNVSVPGGAALRGLGFLGIDLIWLLSGRGKDELALALPHSVDPAQQLHAWYEANEAFALIPLYDVRAAAGHGALARDQPAPEHWPFSRAWLAKHVGVAPERLKLITVAGDSMELDLHDGDVVMIHTGDPGVLREGVYAFALDGHVYVKRLVLQGDRLIISRSAERFPARAISTLQENPTFRLIGRVVGQPTFKRF